MPTEVNRLQLGAKQDDTVADIRTGAKQMRYLRLPFLFLTVALGVAFCERAALAQKIYLLVAADTEDPKIGAANEQDMGNVYGTFVSHVPEEQLKLYGEGTGDFSWTGPSVQEASDMKSAILNAIARCPAGGNDTIVFYWSGHGMYDSRGHYLVMPDRKPLYRSEVVAAIRRKSPRLAVVISDSCNDWLDSRRLDPFALPVAAPPLRLPPLFDSLFIRPRGLVDINASSEEETAICFDSCGGLFTSALVSNLEAFDGSEPAGRGIHIEVRPPSGGRQRKEVPLGYLWTHSAQRRSWNDLVTHVNQTMRRQWRGVTDQTVRVWSLPDRVASQPPEQQGGIPRVLSLTRNDVILSINDKAIRSEADCRRAIASSGRVMEFTVRDSRDGTVWRMQARLSDREPRFGVYLDDARGGGALVTRVRFGSPATLASVVERVAGGGGPRQPPQPRDGLPKALSLSRGDVILSINGQVIHDRNDCIRAVNASPSMMTFTVRDSRDGTVWRMRTQLRSQGTRFGVNVEDAEGEGALVTSVFHGYPGTNNEVLGVVSDGR